MKEEDLQDYIQRYEGRLKEFGYSPQTLGWGRYGRQEVRFSVLAQYALQSSSSSILDVGCGFADLYEFLRARGWSGKYTGVDIVPGLLEVARKNHPNLDIRELDISESEGSLGIYDFVIASGVMNAELKAGDNEAHIESMLRIMHRHARTAVCVDFLSAYVDFRKPGSWHTDPCWALGMARQLSRRTILRLDYMPYEFSVFIFGDDAISERNVFSEFEKSLL